MVIYVDNKYPLIEENNLNYIPCSINFNGTAEVSTYFNKSENIDGGK